MIYPLSMSIQNWKTLEFKKNKQQGLKDVKTLRSIP